MDPGEIVEPKLDMFMCKIKGLRKLYSWCGVGGVDISYIKIPFYDAAAEKLSHGTMERLYMEAQDGLKTIDPPLFLNIFFYFLLV